MADLKEKARDRDKARYFAQDTLRMVIDWVRETNPQTYLSKETKDVLGTEQQSKIKDWVDKSGELIDKTWVLPNLLVDDAVRVLTEATGAKPPTTPETK
ncbi:MAG: hypothetical protein Q8O55_04060 [Dehalococcoidales bacterium]|nr:hypothetical protein [Dehalococcoidales bacterium]